MDFEKYAAEAHDLVSKPKKRSYAKHIGTGALVGAGIGAGVLSGLAHLGPSVPSNGPSTAALAGIGALGGAIPGALLGGLSTNHHVTPGVGLAAGVIPAPRIRLKHKDTGNRTDFYFL